MSPCDKIRKIAREGEEISSKDGRVQVLGETEPGSKVLVDGRPAAVDDQGNFSYSLPLHEGKNRIRITTTDKNKNINKLDRVVYRLLPGQDTKFQKSRQRAAKGKTETRSSPLATFGLGLLTIGTILGIVILIIG